MATRASALGLLIIMMTLASVLSCGVYLSFDGYDPASNGGKLYGVRGNVDGLGGANVTVLLNGARGQSVSDGPFDFPDALPDGADFFVTHEQDPEGHACSIERGSGTLAGADAVGVAVHCPSTDAMLATLSVSAGPVSPMFEGGKTEYSVGPVRAPGIFPALVTTTVTATAHDAGATIQIAGVATPGATPSAPIALKQGPTTIEIAVTAADRRSTRHYKVTVSGTASPDYLKASNTRSLADFGFSVALNGNTLAVGSPGESSGATGVNGDQADISAPQAGAVYIFTRIGDVWTQQAYLKASNPRSGGLFGSAVALDGETLAVGSPGETSLATGVNGSQAADTDPFRVQHGAVYIFARIGGLWSQQAYVKASNTRAFAMFGASVALSGNTLAAGSPGESSDGTGVNGDQTAAIGQPKGAAYVFTRTAGNWSQQAYVKASNTRPAAGFGTAVSLDTDGLAVGSPGESSASIGVNGSQADGGLSDAGAAYVFSRVGSTWSQQAYIKASNTRQGASFGASLCLGGDTLAVGSPGETSIATGVNGNQGPGPGASHGAVYVLTRNAAAWSQQAYVKASNTISAAEIGAAFGSSTSLTGDRLAVGSRPSASGTPFSGAAYVFARAGAAWSEQAYVKASNARAGARFGHSVTLSADGLAVGSPDETSGAVGVNGNQNDMSSQRAGAVYVFR